jgi:hypothetical protein
MNIVSNIFNFEGYTLLELETNSNVAIYRATRQKFEESLKRNPELEKWFNERIASIKRSNEIIRSYHSKQCGCPLCDRSC